MKRSHQLLVALIAFNLILLVVGGRSDTLRAGRGGSIGVDIGLVFDVGGLGDKSFNDAAYRGLINASEELGVGIRYVEPGDGSDRESALRQLASSGADLVIGVGFIFTDDIRKLAEEFPDVKFACIDYSVVPGQPGPPDNLVGLRFREHEGSFLVGAIAALRSQTKKVGFIGGMDIPLIHKFEAGYVAGAKHVCPDCEVMIAYAGTEPKAFSDPITGKELAMTQYGRGADVIYHASGKTGTGVFNAARQLGKLAIGVDSDQFDEAPCCVLTSMVKNVDVAVLEVIRDVVNHAFKGGVREFGLVDDGVRFVYDDNNRELLPESIVKRVNALAQEIIEGTIEVPSK